jgi:hypothetical protein
MKLDFASMDRQLAWDMRILVPSSENDSHITERVFDDSCPQIPQYEH